MGSSTARYENLPYFFSDQYDLGMEYVGHASADSTAQVVVRGDKDAREFVAFWLDEDNHVLAAMNVNVWDVVDQLKPIIAERRVVDPAKLADDSVAWSDVVVTDDERRNDDNDADDTDDNGDNDDDDSTEDPAENSAEKPTEDPAENSAEASDEKG